MGRAGRSRGQVLAGLVLVLMACAGGYASTPVDDIALRVDRGVNPGEAKLQWTGGIGPFTVHRSSSPISLTDLANVIGTVTGSPYVDPDLPPPPANIFFYEMSGTSCASDAGCPTGHCVDGVCCTTSCTGTCLGCNLAGQEGSCTPIPSGSDPAAECGAGAACDGTGACRSTNGETCGVSGACLSGNCVDGVCCSTACNGLCRRCDLAGSQGTCSSALSGTDPDNECPIDPAPTCGRTGACSGSGACALYAPGTVCVPPSCASSASLNLADACDGAGTCVDGGAQSCPADTCGGYSACSGYTSVCDISASRTRTCTPHPCSSNACGDGTPYVETDTSGCVRVTTGVNCGQTSIGCPIGQHRNLCCNTTGGCATVCGECSP